MCFAQDYKAQKWIVIDGLQRISTIARFLEGGDWTLSLLDDIDSEIAGKSVAAIKTAKNGLHQYYTRVENLSIPITVLRCDFQKKNHMEFLFTIFHRLNTGGMKLNNQEIRNCIYGGQLNNLLKELDNHKNWRSLNKMRSDASYRFAKQEIILRFFAFYERRESYDGHLAKFLNNYMHDHRRADDVFLKSLKEHFIATVDAIHEKIFLKVAPKKLPVTVLESILVGVGVNIEHVTQQASEDTKNNYDALLKDPKFSDVALREGLSKKPRVTERLETAVNLFGL